MYAAALKNCRRTHSGPVPFVEGAHATWRASAHSPPSTSLPSALLSAGGPRSSLHPHPSASGTERLAASALQSDEHLAAVA